MVFREATVADIEQMMVVRMAVKENILRTSSLVTYKDYMDYLTVRGKGWLCEIDSVVVGFVIVSVVDTNVWALFVEPNYETKGIGKKLQNMMLLWYFTKTQKTLWLGTAPGTRAEKFYSLTGWKNVGIVNKGETKFEMTFDAWNEIGIKSFSE